MADDHQGPGYADIHSDKNPDCATTCLHREMPAEASEVDLAAIRAKRPDLDGWDRDAEAMPTAGRVWIRPAIDYIRQLEGLAVAQAERLARAEADPDIEAIRVLADEGHYGIAASRINDLIDRLSVVQADLAAAREGQRKADLEFLSNTNELRRERNQARAEAEAQRARAERPNMGRIARFHRSCRDCDQRAMLEHILALEKERVAQAERLARGGITEQQLKGQLSEADRQARASREVILGLRADLAAARAEQASANERVAAYTIREEQAQAEAALWAELAQAESDRCERLARGIVTGTLLAQALVKIQDRHTARLALLEVERQVPRCGNTGIDPATERRIRSLRGETPPGFDGCGNEVSWILVYRCLECGRYMHAECLRKHFASHGDEPSQLKLRVIELEHERDGLLAEIHELCADPDPDYGPELNDEPPPDYGPAESNPVIVEYP